MKSEGLLCSPRPTVYMVSRGVPEAVHEGGLTKVHASHNPVGLLLRDDDHHHRRVVSVVDAGGVARETRGADARR